MNVLDERGGGGPLNTPALTNCLTHSVRFGGGPFAAIDLRGGGDKVLGGGGIIKIKRTLPLMTAHGRVPNQNEA